MKIKLLKSSLKPTDIDISKEIVYKIPVKKIDIFGNIYFKLVKANNEP